MEMIVVKENPESKRNINFSNIIAFFSFLLPQIKSVLASEQLVVVTVYSSSLQCNGRVNDPVAS